MSEIQQQPPGWYTAGPGVERWWDGAAWGEQVRASQVQQAGPSKAVTYQPRRTSHLLHLVLTIITLGAWAPVWIVVTILNNLSRQKVVTKYR